MKAKLVLGGVAVLMSVPSVLAADPTTTMVWEFDNADNPAVVEPGPAENPFSGIGTATINQGTGTGYWSGVFLDDPGLGYGTPTGLWDILNGDVSLSIDLFASPGTQVTYELTVGQFVSPQNFPFSSDLSFSIPDGQLVSQSGVENTPNGGTWVESTYLWENLSVNGPLSLTLSSVTGAGLLLDSLAISVTGSLVPIPEPSAAQLGLLGLGMTLLWSARRRKA